LRVSRFFRGQPIRIGSQFELTDCAIRTTNWPRKRFKASSDMVAPADCATRHRHARHKEAWFAVFALGLLRKRRGSYGEDSRLFATVFIESTRILRASRAVRRVQFVLRAGRLALRAQKLRLHRSAGVILWATDDVYFERMGPWMASAFGNAASRPRSKARGCSFEERATVVFHLLPDHSFFEQLHAQHGCRRSVLWYCNVSCATNTKTCAGYGAYGHTGRQCVAELLPAARGHQSFPAATPNSSRGLPLLWREAEGR